MVEDVHDKAVEYFLSNCQDLAILSILAYGSYARRDFRPDSDIDLLVVLDSKKYSSGNLKRLVEIAEESRERFGISLNMDIMLDSEIDLWNLGILLEGHSFIDLSFYRKEGKILFGVDIRDRFKIPEDFMEKSKMQLTIVESEFKRWLLEDRGELVPHWLTGWLLATFLNTLGITEVTSFNETCRLVEGIPFLATTPQFEKYKQKKELTPDEFIDLNRTIRRYSQRT